MLTTADRRETDFRRKPLWGEQSESKDTIERRGRCEMEQPQVGPEGEGAGATESKCTEKFENNSLTEAIIGAAITVHRELGPGLLESVYEKCLAFELADQGLSVTTQKEIPVRYKNLTFDCSFRADLIVENKVLLELKSIDQLSPIHTSQVITYLKLTGLRTALLINFNVQILKTGLKRISL
jgi:GxxExxY protein